MKRTMKSLLSALILMAIMLAACTSAATQTAAPQPATEPTVANTEPSAAPTTPPTEPTAVPEEPTPTVTEPSVEPSTGAVQLPEVDPAAVSGDIIAAGSSTVFPLAEALALRFEDEGYTGKLTIDSIGSGAGLERFCVAGETDIANASRKIKDTEVESCKAIGREPIEFRVGTDALAIVVSSENDFLTDVSLEDLAKIFSSDAQKWSDVNPDWPAEDILRYSPGTDSGTFDFFVEFVMRPVYGQDNEADRKAILEAANINLSEDDNVLVQGVEGSPYAIGYFGYAYYQENADQLKAISINGITPSEETAESNEYPLARPLFMYSSATILQEKPQVAGFLNFVLTYVNEEIEAVGYFPASSEALDTAKQSWMDAAGQ